jgi:hypothetical protein
MKSSQQDLLNRILASPYFAHTVTLGRILSYVCENTVDTQNRIKEYEIATEVLRRDQSFDPKLDPVVRVSMKGVRERLEKYFDDAGEREPLRLVIPKGQYHVEFIESRLAPVAAAQDHTHVLRYFWGPYLIPNQTNLLVHTEPLFFREGWETYVRNLYVNDPARGRRQLEERLPELKSRELVPSYHYLDAGEVNSMFLFMQFFHDLGAPANVKNARITSWHEMRYSNLVMVGCTRTNPFMDMLQEKTSFMIAEDEIRNLSPAKGELPSYKGERYRDSKLQRYKEYVLVTRRPGTSQNNSPVTMTMISANHGRAIEGATNYLTSEREVSKLLSAINVDPERSALPDRFQFLLRVEMIDVDDEIVDVEYVSHRMGD